MSAFLSDPLLAAVPAEHGFGTRDAALPAGVVRAQQVHGTRVVDAADCRPGQASPEADAVLAALPGAGAAVVTADCVPVLLAAPGAAAVAAVHAGWRGLAAGVVEAGVAALAQRAGCPSSALVAAIGPHVGACCYEVDEPVLSALGAAYAGAARAAARPTRPGHAQLDLGAVVRAALRQAGLGAASIGEAAVACTACDAQRFHSYRRDGPRAGRLVHYVRVAGLRG